MNEQQRLYLVQSRTDWRLFGLLKGESVCHRLHYLQMCTEKLAKAYFWKSRGAENFGHAAFTKFLRTIATNRRIAKHLGFDKTSHFQEWINEISDLVYEVERLAPDLARGGPNPEYPWPREFPCHAPVEHSFSVWGRLVAQNGRNLLWMLNELIAHFDAWF